MQLKTEKINKNRDIVFAETMMDYYQQIFEHHAKESYTFLRIKHVYFEQESHIFSYATLLREVTNCSTLYFLCEKIYSDKRLICYSKQILYQQVLKKFPELFLKFDPYFDKKIASQRGVNLARFDIECVEKITLFFKQKLKINWYGSIVKLKIKKFNTIEEYAQYNFFPFKENSVFGHLLMEDLAGDICFKAEWESLCEDLFTIKTMDNLIVRCHTALIKFKTLALKKNSKDFLLLKFIFLLESTCYHLEQSYKFQRNSKA